MVNRTLNFEAGNFHFLLKNHIESLPDCLNAFCTYFELYYIYIYIYVHIVVEVNMNMAEYGSQRSQQPENVNFELIVKGLKSDIFY